MKKELEYITAIHEAGHAVMDLINHKTINYITIVPSKDGVLGETRSEFSSDILNDDNTEALDKKVAIMCMGRIAGITAETLVLGIEPEKCAGHGRMDTFEMGALIANMFDDDDARSNYINEVNQNVLEIFSDPVVQKYIKAIADALMEHKTLSGEQVKKIIS
ncbi:MAG: Peptidase family [Neobacillus sp.]|nr:Peptidase family [Neobacillus sp.]